MTVLPFRGLRLNVLKADVKEFRSLDWTLRTVEKPAMERLIKDRHGKLRLAIAHAERCPGCIPVHQISLDN